MYRKVKRAADCVIAATALLALSPVIALTALAVKLDSRGPVIFRQERLGYKGRVFKMLKFRSMCVGAEKQGSGVYSFAGDARVTKVGRIIRATSLDELPQLINILRGDMSLIGPRPALTYHPWTWDKYTPEQRRMFDVLPGVTGWAQVNGRKEVPWPERIKLNVEYVDRMSFAFDVKIFFMTIFKVVTNANNTNTTKTNA